MSGVVGGSSLARLSVAERMLAEIASADEALQVIDYAEAARVYARQTRLGTAAINHATVVKLRAERRLADVVDEGQARGEIATAGGDPIARKASNARKLEDLGVKSGRLAEARQIRDHFTDAELERLAEEKSRLDVELSRKRLLRVARERGARQRREQQQASVVELHPDADLRHGDFREVLGDLDGQAAAVITDPPYAKSAHDLYPPLAEHAARLLRPGGVLVVLCGTSPVKWLPLIGPMAEHLPLRWVGCYLTSGAAWRDYSAKVGTNWKPLLIFGEGPSLGTDVFESAADDKTHHRWGQDEHGFAKIVQAFSNPGDLVVDPFLGGGTTAIVCHQLGRRSVGCDVDDQAVATARGRLAP